MRTLIHADKTASLNPDGLSLSELFRRLSSPVIVEEDEAEKPKEKASWRDRKKQQAFTHK